MLALSRSAARVARRGLPMATRFASVAAAPSQEAEEMRLLEQYAGIASALDAPLAHSADKARTLAQQVQASVVQTDVPEKLKESLTAAHNAVSNAKSELGAASHTEDASAGDRELSLKFSLLNQQTKLWADKPATYSSWNPNVDELANAILTADGQHRLEAYLRSYGPKINEPELQQAVEDYCHATANTWSFHLQSYSPVADLLKPKKHQKFVKKFINGYVRDVLDVGLKSRCMFYWAEKTEEEKDDPNMVKSPELVKINVDSILQVQKQYFPEVGTLVQVLTTDYRKKRAEFYEAKRKRKQLYIQGAAFFIVINVADFIVQLL